MKNIAILFCLLFLVSCSNDPSPSNILNQYLDANFEFDFEQAYSLVSQEDKSIKSLQIYLDETNDEGFIMAKIYAEKSTFKIIGIEKKNEKAMAIVEFTIPDREKIAGELMTSLYSLAFDKDLNDEELTTLIKE